MVNQIRAFRPKSSNPLLHDENKCVKAIRPNYAQIQSDRTGGLEAPASATLFS